jgi:DNA repair exonuclease SbcCD ATPase subunit
MNRAFLIVAVAIFLLVMTSCDEDDERLAQFAAESVRQQAGQNREMSQLNREVAQAHQDLVGLQQNLEEQQVQVNHQRDELESERREIAKQRHRDPIIAAAINNVGLVLACLIPLALAGYLLYCLRNQDDDEAVGELLIQELTTDRPLLLPLAPGPATDERPSLSDDGPRPSLPQPESQQS